MIKIKKCNFNKIKKLIFNPLSIILFFSIIPIIISLIMFFQTGIMPVKSIPLLFNLEIKEYYLIYDSLPVFIFLFSLFKIIEEIKKIEYEEIKNYLIFTMVIALIIGIIMSLINLFIGSLISLYVSILIPLLLGLIIIILGKILDKKVSLLWGISLGTGFGLILSLKELIFIFIPLLCLLFCFVFIVATAIQTIIISLKIK